MPRMEKSHWKVPEECSELRALICILFSGKTRHSCSFFGIFFIIFWWGTWVPYIKPLPWWRFLTSFLPPPSRWIVALAMFNAAPAPPLRHSNPPPGGPLVRLKILVESIRHGRRRCPMLWWWALSSAPPIHASKSVAPSIPPPSTFPPPPPLFLPLIFLTPLKGWFYFSSFFGFFTSPLRLDELKNTKYNASLTFYAINFGIPRHLLAHSSDLIIPSNPRGYYPSQSHPSSPLSSSLFQFLPFLPMRLPPLPHLLLAPIWSMPFGAFDNPQIPPKKSPPPAVSFFCSAKEPQGGWKWRGEGKGGW